PHISVKDINSIDFRKLREKGIKGIISDWDDVLPLQNTNQIYGSVKSKVGEMREVYGGRILIRSNRAGVRFEDPDYIIAKGIEGSIGIGVARTFWKKPLGLMKLCYEFGCPPENLAVIDDRISTGILGGNLCGMLTIYTLGLSIDVETRFEKGLRAKERRLVKSLMETGVTAPVHGKYYNDACLEEFI
ncbi:hypothetical protein KY306_01305, partial [Candidatus Woesearchaeota archaeon]|nr:hypothetical protein [Candidatus Woesearchaeota archaeon]